MTERLFLYIDILGFKEMVRSGLDVRALYDRIDRMNVHTDKAFQSIVFSDTILVYGSDGWLDNPSQGLMWLFEFAQDLFYNLISLDRHIRAYTTKGNFEHHKLKNVEVYYGNALVDCYERERAINCTGVFLDSRLAHLSNIFHLTKYDDKSHFAHVMQDLDSVSTTYAEYPLSGYYLKATGMEWRTAYPLRYLRNIHGHANDAKLEANVRLKYQNAWKMIADRHYGLCRRLAEAEFEYGKVIQLDWTEMLRRIGTEEGDFR